MRLQAQTAEKLAERFRPNTALETERKKGGDPQTQEPTVAFFRFPPPRLWVAVSAFHRLFETMHTALGEPGLMSHVSDALRGVVIKSVDNAKTFGPKFHVGLSSEE
jgi:hypothetical protein